MASAINALTGSSNTGTQSALSGTKAPTEQMFLQLLVAQLKNQDPMNPTDGTQFVSQLAQFSELEQVIGIRGDIETQQATAATQAAAAAAGTTNSGTTGSGTTTNSPTTPNTTI